jgi:hypothetical protein
MKIRNKWIDNLPISEVAEPVLGESMTLPDQCMTIQEIFQRFAIGQNLEMTDCRNPVYGDVMEDYEFDELHDMVPKRDIDEIFDGDDEESSESSESEQAPAVPQTDIGKEPAPQVSTPPSEGEKQADTAQ